MPGLFLEGEIQKIAMEISRADTDKLNAFFFCAIFFNQFFPQTAVFLRPMDYDAYQTDLADLQKIFDGRFDDMESFCIVSCADDGSDFVPGWIVVEFGLHDFILGVLSLRLYVIDSAQHI